MQRRFSRHDRELDFTQAFSASGSSTVSVLIDNDTSGDPLPGVSKTVQIQEQASPQTITVNGRNVTVSAIGASACQQTANPSVINFQNATVGYPKRTAAVISMTALVIYVHSL